MTQRRRVVIWIASIVAVVVVLDAVPESWCLDDPRVCEADR